MTLTELRHMAQFWEINWTCWETWRPAWRTAWGRARPATRCRQSSSTDPAACGVRAVPDRGRGAVPDAGAPGPAENQGQAGSWDHRLLSPAGKRGAFLCWGVLDSSNSLQTIQKTATCRIEDGDMVSETNDPEVLRRWGSGSRIPFGEQEANKKFRGQQNQSINQSIIAKACFERSIDLAHEQAYHRPQAHVCSSSFQPPWGQSYHWCNYQRPVRKEKRKMAHKCSSWTEVSG